MTVRGYGETQPVAPNTRPDGSDDPAGRRKNRRVVVAVTRP
jgi:outer membrane protein OmpA-like peptidoglycan-associated protein